MQTLVKDVTNFETTLLESFILEDSNILLSTRERKRLKKEILQVLNESYKLLNKDEKKSRLMFLEGLRNKSQMLLEQYGIIPNSKNILVLEEFKNTILKSIRENIDSYKLFESVHHFKTYFLINYLIPDTVRNRLSEQDITTKEKIDALMKTITKLVVTYHR